MLVKRVGLGVCVGLAGVACQALFGVDEQGPAASTTSSSPSTTASSASAGGAGGTTASSGGGIAGMGGLGGAPGVGGSSGSGGGPVCAAGMVFVPGAAWSFCIDQFEVTRLQYQAWLDTQPPPPDPMSKCAWNDSYQPKDSGFGCDATDYDPANNPEYPVVCVDWCDARAYCEGAGKRLCGQVGSGTSFNYGAFADAAVSEWYFACSLGGTLPYPYGSSYDPNICYGDDHDGIPFNGDTDKPAPVTAKPMCVGGFPGIRHMSGNVWEWENACTPDPMIAGDGNDVCSDRGGSFWDPFDWLMCDHAPPGNHTRSSYNQNVGIRCCADVLAPPP